MHLTTCNATSDSIILTAVLTDEHFVSFWVILEKQIWLYRAFKEKKEMYIPFQFVIVL